MKKKLFFSYVILCLIIVSLVSCQKNNEAVELTIPTTSKVENNSSFDIIGEQNSKLKNFDKALKVLNLFLQECTDREWLMSLDYKSLLIKTLDARYELVAINTSDDTTVQTIYFVIDLIESKCTQIQITDSIPHAINEITYEDGIIRFYSDGSNAINSFVEFPLYYYYDIQKKVTTKEIASFPLTYEGTNIATGMNSYGIKEGNQFILNKISAHDSQIDLYFDFEKGAIEAGGMFCPRIHFYTSGENLLVLDIASTVANVDKNVLEQLKEISFLENVLVGEYTDGLQIHHATLTFEFDEANERYSCEFIMDENSFAQPIITIY